jgi:CHAT domain-containing protein
VATHGFFLSDVSAGENERGFAGLETKKIIENPLLRSGLLLAGANNAFDDTKDDVSNDEDGILTALEVMNLELDKTDLVVMSACETGVGITSAGEGVYGLQRSFQVAGAKSVLMSLWNVSDEATEELMILFYRYWLEDKTISTSFRKAQLAIKKKYPHPYFWAAFVLMGK